MDGKKERKKERKKKRKKGWMKEKEKCKNDVKVT